MAKDVVSVSFEVDAEQANKAISGISGAMAAIGGAAIAGRAMRAIKDLTQESLTLAGAAQEVESKFRVVFGDEAANVRDWAGEFSTAVGRSETAMLGFLSSIQDTLIPLGMTRTAAAGMSQEIVSLATDLGSFNNVDPSVVIRDFQSALVGNTETLRKYGVVANQAQIEQFAYANGLAETGAQLTPLQKAQAIYSLAVQGSADAMGDAVRTADSFVNSKRALESAVDDLKIAFGELATDGVAKAQSSMAGLVQEMAETLDTKNIVRTVREALDTGSISNIALDELTQFRTMLEEEGGLFQQAYENILLGNERGALLDSVNEEIRLREQMNREAAGMAAEEERRSASQRTITELAGIEADERARMAALDGPAREEAGNMVRILEAQVMGNEEVVRLEMQQERIIADLALNYVKSGDEIERINQAFSVLIGRAREASGAFRFSDSIQSGDDAIGQTLQEMTTNLSIMSGVIGQMPDLPFDPLLIDDTADSIQTLAEVIEDLADVSLASGIQALGMMADSMTMLAVEGEKGWQAYANAGLQAVASVARAVGAELAIKAVAALPNVGLASLFAGGSVAAYSLAGALGGAGNRISAPSTTGATSVPSPSNLSIASNQGPGTTITNVYNIQGSVVSENEVRSLGAQGYMAATGAY